MFQRKTSTIKTTHPIIQDIFFKFSLKKCQKKKYQTLLVVKVRMTE
jgi:hypothetical protein